MRPRRAWPLLLLAMVLALSACTAGQRPSPTSSVAPDHAELTQAVDDFLASPGHETVQAVLVSVDGNTVVERYRGARADQPLHVWSVTKSFLGTLVGIAVADGLIDDLDQTLAQLLPRHRSAMDARVAAVTLRQLLTMTAGFPEGLSAQRFGSDPDFVTSLLRTGIDRDPGTAFAYSNAGSHLVAAVLDEALRRDDARRSMLDYAREKLFDPLGIKSRPAYQGAETWAPSSTFDRSGFAWATDRQGIPHGCCLLRVTPRDMQKLGQLYLADGVWEGRQLVPREWVKQATTGTELSDYGYLWWVNPVESRASFAASGAFGQLVVVVPDRRLVVTVASRTDPGLSSGPEDLVSLVSDVVLPRLG
jgi:CubicO group peptidase (beta-lactamase class C family)